MHQGEGEDPTEVGLEKELHALGKLQLMVVNLEGDVAAGHIHQHIHSLADACRGIDIDGLDAPAEMHAAQQSGKPEEVVAVEVGEADVGEALHFLMIDPKLGLGVLATVEEDPKSVDVQHLRTAVTGHSGERGS